MARITVDDCLEQIGDENRFALVHLTVARIKQLRRGAPLLVTNRKNKEIVMALREIAAGEVTLDNLRTLAKPGNKANLGTEAKIAVGDADLAA
ncbi:MAG: DNA-directed RNA polymerase subunit omega [Deltaproteobacteria bacterium RIFOXYD12_FULL_57_12]|nr:MAG: DNA-directed RNA polymerase subunit omega [Deltaproteobacteria bacterium RIFOXYD12_FULL_57_12]